MEVDQSSKKRPCAPTGIGEKKTNGGGIGMGSPAAPRGGEERKQQKGEKMDEEPEGLPNKVLILEVSAQEFLEVAAEAERRRNTQRKGAEDDGSL